MRMNRRNVLVGLGTIVAGGGAALGTGAFSSVEADRTVNVGIAGDSSALLAIDADSNYESSTGNNVDRTIIDFSGDKFGNASGLNTEAETTFNAVLAITNQGADTVELKDSIGGTSLSSASFNLTSEITLQFGFGSTDDVDSSNFDSPASDAISDGNVVSSDTLSSNETVFYNLTFDITDPSNSDNRTNFNSDITLVAESTS